MTSEAALEAIGTTRLAGLGEPRRGKVRDVYDLGDALLIVATDRLSAYDHVLSPPIPGKGKILTQLANFWFDRTADLVPNHLLATKVDEFPPAAAAHAEVLAGRAILARKAEVIPFECVARGFLAGSAFKEYRRDGTACGIPLPAGLERASRLPEPIFTPATKAESGHDENVSFDYVADALGAEVAGRLRDLTLELYSSAARHAETCGLILADTKFEFGASPGAEVVLGDEVLTPDSSRFWPADEYEPGRGQASFDKQFVRDYLSEQDWNKEPPAPPLPAEVIEGTTARYREAYERITGRELG